MKEKNKSKWYILREISHFNWNGGLVTKSIYDIRIDKEPEEVELGDYLLLLDCDNEQQTTGIVMSIDLHEDGLFKIGVVVAGQSGLFFTTPNRVGILKK